MLTQDYEPKDNHHSCILTILIAFCLHDKVSNQLVKKFCPLKDLVKDVLL